MKSHLRLVLVLSILVLQEGWAQKIYSPGIQYDAREFLSKIQQSTFKIQYPDFDSPKPEKNWEWSDVDPLALFTPDENRLRRREQFLFDYTPSAMREAEGKPSSSQEAYRTILLARYGGTVLMSGLTVKIMVGYTDAYENKDLYEQFLAKVAELGLEWQQLKGNTAYLYNGNLLVAKYQSGWVTLGHLDIDKPARRQEARTVR